VSLARIINGMAFENDLGVVVSRKHRDGVSVTLKVRPNLLNGNGVMHGGVIASIADEAAWHAIRHHFAEDRPCTTTELKVNYLRPIGGKKAMGRAFMLRAGKTLCVVRVDIFDDQRRLSATSIVTYLLLGRPHAVVAAR
jgi:uncharacterized protein (TIGR00369 family)